MKTFDFEISYKIECDDIEALLIAVSERFAELMGGEPDATIGTIDNILYFQFHREFNNEYYMPLHGAVFDALADCLDSFSECIDVIFQADLLDIKIEGTNND